MSNSNYQNVEGKKNFRTNNNNDRSNFKGKFGGSRDSGGFRIRLSDNEMKAVKNIQEKYQLKSTVAVLGFAVRTLSEMTKDDELNESINKYAFSNKNYSSKNNNSDLKERKKDTSNDPFARPVKVEKIKEEKADIKDLDDK